jgi:hypothetical protein
MLWRLVAVHIVQHMADGQSLHDGVQRPWVHVTEEHPKVGTRMLTEPIQASCAASRYSTALLWCR